MSPSSNHRVTISSANSLLWSTDEGGSHVGLLSVAKVGITDTAVFLRVASKILQSTDVRLMGLNCLGSVVRVVFATGVTIARRQSSGTWAVLSERLNILPSTGEMWEVRALRLLKPK